MRKGVKNKVKPTAKPRPPNTTQLMTLLAYVPAPVDKIISRPHKIVDTSVIDNG